MLKSGKRLYGGKPFKPRKKTTEDQKKITKSEVKTLVEKITAKSDLKIKSTYVAVQSIATNSAGYVNAALTNIGQGVSASQRVGNRCRLNKISFKYVASSNSSTKDLYLRVLLVSAGDTELDDNADTWFLNDSNVPQAPTANVLKDVVMPICSRFGTVVYDKVHYMPKTTDGSGRGQGGAEIMLPHSRILDFSTSATADAAKNNLRLLVLAREVDASTGAGTEACLFTFYLQAHFSEI